MTFCTTEKHVDDILHSGQDVDDILHSGQGGR